MTSDEPEGTATVRVVVVDDDPAVVSLASEYLEHTDGRFSVFTETSARAAVERLRDCDARIDCIVSDYEMPGMNGLEFREAVQETCSDVPFILFTSHARDLFEEAPPEGITELIRKDGRRGNYSELADRVTRAAESGAS